MDSAPKVQLLLKDRLIQEVRFEGESLRIGRMKENDLVVNNLAVSRFHAVLHRDAQGTVRLEDLGSENGTLVNGVAVSGVQELGAGDTVAIGKHVLRLSEMATGDPVLEAAPIGSSDAWDAAQTYFGGALPGAVAGPATNATPTSLDDVLAAEPLVEADPADPAAPVGTTERPEETAEVPVLVESPARGSGAVASDGDVLGPDDSPDPSGAYSIGEEEVLADAVPTRETDFSVTDSEVTSAPPAALDSNEHTALFDFGPAGDLASSEEPVAAVEADGADEAGLAFPSVAEQTEESVDTAARILPLTEEAHTTEWSPDVEALEAARPTPEQHAGWIVQQEGRLQGVVPWERDELAVGRAEGSDITLAAAGVSRSHATFVRGNAGYEVRDEGSVNGTWVNGERVVGSWALRVGDVVRIEDFALTFVLDHQPVGSAARAHAAAVSAAEAGNHTLLSTDAGTPEPTAMVDLLDEDESLEDGEKELETSGSPGFSNLPMAAVPDDSERVCVEIAIPRDALPPALRLAMEESGEDALRLPAEIRIRIR